MVVWVTTFEDCENWSTLIGVYDSRDKAWNAGTQYLRDFEYNDVTTYGQYATNEWLINESGNVVMTIERTVVV